MGSDGPACSYKRGLTDVHDALVHDEYGAYEIMTSKRNVRYKSLLKQIAAAPTLFMGRGRFTPSAARRMRGRCQGELNP